MTDKLKEIPKAYDPSKTEDKWYKYWLDNELFHSEPNEPTRSGLGSKPPFTIAIPPPNVTGMLRWDTFSTIQSRMFTFG